MKFKLEEYHRNTPDEILLADIKIVSKKLNKNTVTIREYNQFGKYSAGTLCNRFGSWFTVLEKAGLIDSRSRINIATEDLFTNIETVWINLGRQPRYNEMKKPLSKYGPRPYERLFGSWRKALEEFIKWIEDDTIENVTEPEQIILNSNKAHLHKTKRDISDRMRFRILLRDGFTCKKCGRSPLKSLGVELHVDHILPWSKGGETVVENLETKCEKCNLGKGNAFEG